MAIVRAKVPASNIVGTLTNSQLPVISTNNLPTIDYSKLPAGSVIQVAYGRYDPNSDSYTSIASDTEADSPLSLTMTPRLANSKLWVVGRMHVRMDGAPGCSFGIKRDNVKQEGMSQRGGTSNDFFYKGESLNHHYTGHTVLYVDANSTASTTFKLWGQGWGGTWELSYGHGEHSLTVYEIKQ